MGVVLFVPYRCPYRYSTPKYFLFYSNDLTIANRNETQTQTTNRTERKSKKKQSAMPRSRSRPAPSMNRAPVRPTTSQPSRASSTTTNKPAPSSSPYGSAPQKAPQQSSGGGMLSGFMGNVVQGMAFGTGSSIAHRAVGAVAGSVSGGEQQPVAPQEAPQQQQAPVQTCSVDQQNFIQCLNSNQGSVEACQFYFDTLNACQKGQSGFA